MTTRKSSMSRYATLLAAGTLMATSQAWALNTGGGETPFDQYAETGPHAVTSEDAGSECTVYRPTQLQGNHPVILWGNGTGANTSIYNGGLEHWASWGYVVVAANTTMSGTGEEMLACLDEISSSSMSAQLNLNRVGTSGHSQGGSGSLMSGQDERITATAPLQPYIQGLGHDSSSQDQQSGPMLLLSGSTDFLAGPEGNQAPVFERTNVPVFWANSEGTSHFNPLGSFGVYRGITTAWFEFQLKGDSEAADIFTGPCTGCDVEGWIMQTKGL